MSAGQAAFTRVEPHDGLFGFRLEFYGALPVPPSADRRIVLAVDVSNRLRPDAAAGERMAALIDAVMPALIDHLAEKAWELLPIVSATLTQSEWDTLGKHGMSAIPLTRRLVILGRITEETDDAERRRFLQVVPAPARLAYQLIGRRQLIRETTAIRG